MRLKKILKEHSQGLKTVKRRIKYLRIRIRKRKRRRLNDFLKIRLKDLKKSKKSFLKDIKALKKAVRLEKRDREKNLVIK